MDTKLTLKLDEEIIGLAKAYVKKRGTSLSKFIEDFLRESVQNSGKKDAYDIEILPALQAMETGVDYVAKNNLKVKNTKKETNGAYQQKLEEYLKLNEE